VNQTGLFRVRWLILDIYLMVKSWSEDFITMKRILMGVSEDYHLRMTSQVILMVIFLQYSLLKEETALSLQWLGILRNKEEHLHLLLILKMRMLLILSFPTMELELELKFLLCWSMQNKDKFSKIICLLLQNKIKNMQL